MVAADLLREVPQDSPARSGDIYIPQALQLATLNGTLYGYPTENMVTAFTYRADAFQEVGLDENTPPQTWRDLREYARRLTTHDADGEVTRAGFHWLSDTVITAGNFHVLARGHGVETFDPFRGVANFTDPKVIETLEFLRELMDSGTLMFSGAAPYYSGQAAMGIAVGPWVKGSFVSALGQENYRRQMVRSSMIPRPEGGVHAARHYGYRWGVTTDSAYPEEAFAFLDWLTMETTDRGTTRMGDLMNRLGSLPTTKPDLANQDTMEDPFMHAFVETINAGYASPIYWPIGGDQVVLEGITRLLRSNESIAQIVNDVQLKLQVLLDESAL